MELIEANAEDVPLPDASFDLALSEYGASIWCDPYRWIPEAARLLRPGGELVFLRNSTLSVLCAPDDRREGRRTSLLRPQFGLHRMEWSEDEGVDFQLPHGEWIRLLLEERIRGRGALGIQAQRARRRTGTTASCRPSGRASGRPRRSGRPASAGERPAGSADHSRVRLAAAAGDPRAARVPFRVVPPRFEESGRRSGGARGRGRRARWTVASARCSGSTPRSSWTASRSASPARDGAEAMLERLSGRTHEVVSGLCLRTAALGGAAQRDDVVTFRALDARDLAHYVSSGEWEGRAGGIRNPGPRRVARRAHRG